MPDVGPSPPAGGSTAAAALDQLPVLVGGCSGPDHRVDVLGGPARALLARLGVVDVVGRPAGRVLPPPLRGLLPLLDRVRATGGAVTLRDRTLAGPGDGEVLRVDVTVSPRRDDDGVVVGLTVLGVDVTGRAPVTARSTLDVVAELHEALLPSALPVLPGAAVAARHLLGPDGSSAGGDWFDVQPLTGGAVALVVGDVVGHGVVAAAGMAELRAVVSTVLLETGDLHRALAWAERVAVRCPSIEAATMVVAVLDPATGDLRYATCGHPPPLVVSTAGTARPLPTGGGGPLGTGGTPGVAAAALGVGEVLLLHSDGLVGRRGRPASTGAAVVARAAADAAARRVLPVGEPATLPERVCRHVVDEATRGGHDDDVTVLAVQRQEPAGPWRLEVRADASAPAVVRVSLLAWLRRLGVPEHDERALDLTVGELVANVVEHAYADRPRGRVTLAGDLADGGVLLLRVADDGTWREPEGPQDTSGRGLWLAGALADALHVDHDRGAEDRRVRGRGTVVTVRHGVRRPTVVAARSTAPPVPRPRSLGLAVALEEGPPRQLRVTGPVDVATAGLLAERLATTSRGGTQPVAVDLTGADVLASAGVRVLLRARADHADHGHVLRLRAELGTPAREVLDLVGLPVTGGSPHGPGRADLPDGAPGGPPGAAAPRRLVSRWPTDGRGPDRTGGGGRVGTPQTDLALHFVAINDHLTAGGTRDAALGRLVDLAVETVPGCDWAAVTSWPLGRRPESVASSGAVATAADDLQYELRDGPCLAAAADATAVHSSDLAADDRWPRFGAAATRRTPVRGVVSFDLAGEPARHALNLYSGRAGALAEGDLGTAALFAAHARSLLAHAASADQAADLRQALSTSRQIGTAVGILMHLHRTTADEAFQLLVRSSQHLNRKLRDIADDVTETGALPDRPPA